MRTALLLLALLFATPALAQYWDHYSNARFGYGIDIPPGFVGNGESDNGDGQIFYNLESEQSLTVWGSALLGDFEAMVAEARMADERANWMLSEQASSPKWASYAAQRDHRVIAERLILLCDGESYAAFRAEYNIRDLVKMDKVIEGLERSLEASAC